MTNSAALLVLFTLLAFVEERWRAGALAAGLAVVFQPDTAPVALLFAGLCLYRLRRAA